MTNLVQQALLALPPKAKPSIIINTPINTQLLIQSLQPTKQTPDQVIENKILDYLNDNMFCYSVDALRVCELQCFRVLKERLFGTGNYFCEEQHNIYSRNNLLFIQPSSILGGEGFFTLKTPPISHIIKVHTQLKGLSLETSQLQQKYESARRNTWYHKQRSCKLFSRVQYYRKKVKAFTEMKLRFKHQQRYKSLQLLNIKRVCEYSKEIVSALKLEKKTKSFDNEIII